MKKLLFTFFIAFIFSGCSYLNYLNPFSWFESDEEVVKKQIVVPSDAPKWITNTEDKEYLNIIGVSQRLSKDTNDFQKKRAFINASNKALKKIYSTTYTILNDYETKYNITYTFQKDLKNLSKEIALKSLKTAKNTNSYLSEDNTLFILIQIKKENIITILKEEIKTIYKDDKQMQEFFYENNLLKESYD